MKVKIIKDEKMRFEDVNLGEIFQKGNFIYFRTQNFFSEVEHYNAVDIESGSMRYFEKNDEIDRIFKEMILK